MKIGIDASNLLQGGGRTHLIEITQAFGSLGLDCELIVWGAQSTLDLLPNSSIVKVTNKYIEGSFFLRFYWQTFLLHKELVQRNCDILFVPGGNYLGSFSPFVSMSRNMLPFETKELRRYFPSKMFFKLLFLKYTQLLTFRRSTGLIFLSDYAQTAILKEVNLSCYTTIPHGISPTFNFSPKEQRKVSTYSDTDTYKILYVSTVDFYKHQWNVVEAVYNLRKAHGLSLELILCGPANKSAEKKLIAAMDKFDPDYSWVDYRKSVPYSELSEVYKYCDLAVFASSCENMPNTLVEYMMAGLPIASSDYGPMKEVLGDCGLYFDPEKVEGIEQCLFLLIDDEVLRASLAKKSYQRSKLFSWNSCTQSTFEYIKSLTKEY